MILYKKVPIYGRMCGGMGYWSSRGLRGSGLEETVNFTNEQYRKKGLAVIQKVPTPITPVKIDKENKTITLAYFEKQSTVDYIGVAQGVAVCFDAKETKSKSLPFHNIHEHQTEFMREFEKQGGEAFFLVYFKDYDEYYYLPFLLFWALREKCRTEGRSSIPKDDFDKNLKIVMQAGILDYLGAMDTYMRSKKNF